MKQKSTFALFGLYLIGIVNELWGGLRFESPAWNYWFALCLNQIPLILLCVALTVGRRWKIVASLALLPLVLTSLVISLFTALSLQDISLDGVDPGFERIETIEWAGTRIQVYRTNAGAPTPFGIAVRHEMTVLPGILLVKTIYSNGRAEDPTVHLAGKDRLQIDIPKQGPDRTPEKCQVPLKRHIFF